MVHSLLQATVEEALWFSARLRLTNDIKDKTMWAFIHEVNRRRASPKIHAPLSVNMKGLLSSHRQGRKHVV